MLPADMVGGVSTSREANLEVSGDLLKEFQKRVDGVLNDFEGSPGNPTKVAAQTIARTSLSSGSSCFAEADGLYAQYHRVHEHLTSLSKTLGLQIEAIQIAVQGARFGFDSLEEDVRRRFWEIQTRLKQINSADGQGGRTNDAKDGGDF
ncbi:hypothetical protein ACFV6E_26785 [Streptomyces sp. NPDC059785]|uniref:hypothetical protein n=1 Tax=unclassified Streptomyces TaxID=2593676 RepID=UPI00365CC040